MGPVSGVQRTYAGDPVPSCAGFFDLAWEEKCAILELVGDGKGMIEKAEKPAGYNIGFNIGAVAVMHCHCHVIPRYASDTDSPSGGASGVEKLGLRIMNKSS